jgi:hypothetical protein
MRGVPMGVIAAQLGHRYTRMTEKHYAHLAPSYVAETSGRIFPSSVLPRHSSWSRCEWRDGQADIRTRRLSDAEDDPCLDAYNQDGRLAGG